MQDGRLSIERVQMEGRNKTHSLVTGNITWGMLWFAVPMILGNLLQQFYNIADTLIVGRFLGAKALAAVGSAYTLMIFLTSVLLGLCMGSGVVFISSGNKAASAASGIGFTSSGSACQ